MDIGNISRMLFDAGSDRMAMRYFFIFVIHHFMNAKKGRYERYDMPIELFSDESLSGLYSICCREINDYFKEKFGDKKD